MYKIKDHYREVLNKSNHIIFNSRVCTYMELDETSYTVFKFIQMLSPSSTELFYKADSLGLQRKDVLDFLDVLEDEGFLVEES